MLDAVMTAYKKTRDVLIGTFAGTDDVAYEETRFYDLGYMKTQVKKIQKELKSVDDTLISSVKNETSSAEVDNYRNDLMRRREMLIFHMIFTMSNSFANLDNCRKLAEGHDFRFMTCIEGLEEYKKGNKGRAFDLIEGYYREFGSVEGHYLINKVFGLLLSEGGQYKKAIPFLSYALGFMPDDEESLAALSECYKKTGDEKKQRVLADINSLLGYQEVS
ncbi:MAG: tetratricopeptide repeat protein [Lachnospiraceae bacterium]|uniref:Tetratricopeptide repeat protein n=1 Tax=Candidatus Weimeria bifida TaxID=2599074 RepID=A0A6N7IXM5_9FIRM|nr:tetratricopeptide repeat protein [Candidatus Weimeria bifida]RRF95574.1 MAG: tetratricopeptide repeat protein [Lachnospiraceae bacterium]